MSEAALCLLGCSKYVCSLRALSQKALQLPVPYQGIQQKCASAGDQSSDSGLWTGGAAEGANVPIYIVPNLLPQRARCYRGGDLLPGAW